MPPKPPGKPPGNKKPPPKEAAPIDPSVDLKALQVVSDRLTKAKHLRNIFQLERDRVQKMYDVSKEELGKHRTDLLNLESELEEAEASHQVELKVYRQKIRHLRFEHALLLDEIKAKSDKEIADASLQHQRNLAQLRDEKQEMKTTWDTAATEYENEFNSTRQEHYLFLTRTKKDTHEQQLRQTGQRYEQKIALLRDELELRRRVEIHEIEEKKNEHINALIRKHDEAFALMKTYYNKITTNNLELIRTLKEELASMKQNDERNEKLMFDISQFNDRMQGPLEEAQREVAQLQQQLQAYEKDKLSLHNARSRLRAVKRDLMMLEEEHKQLKQKYGEVESDRDGLVRRFEDALREIAEVAQDSNTELQQKLIDTQGRIEERDAQLHHFMDAIHLEPSALENVSKQAEDIIESKNRAIKDLHYELRKVEGQSNKVINEYARRCRVAGVPLLDLHNNNSTIINNQQQRNSPSAGGSPGARSH